MSQLQLSISEHTSKGRKEINQDFHDIRIPAEPLIHTKGVAIAMADGISSSKVSQEASKVSVSYFLQDYFSTSEAWSVKKSAQRVIQATNSWIYAQNRQNLYHLDKDKVEETGLRRRYKARSEGLVYNDKQGRPPALPLEEQGRPCVDQVRRT